MSYDKELEIRRQFLDEAQEYLNALDSVIVGLADRRIDIQKMNVALRGAHSIKGGAGMMELPLLSQLAHRLEDFLKVLKTQKDTIDVDASLENLLLLAVDCLRRVIERDRAALLYSPVPNPTIHQSWDNDEIELVYQQLHDRLGDPPAEDAVSVLAIDSAHDLIPMLFQTEVDGCLQRLEAVLVDPNQPCLREEIAIMAQELGGLGEMLQLDAFCQLCTSIANAMHQAAPHEVGAIGQTALQTWRQAQRLVLAEEFDLLPTTINPVVAAPVPVVEVEDTSGHWQPVEADSTVAENAAEPIAETSVEPIAETSDEYVAETSVEPVAEHAAENLGYDRSLSETALFEQATLNWDISALSDEAVDATGQFEPLARFEPELPFSSPAPLEVTIDYAESLTANGNWDLSERWDDVLAEITQFEPLGELESFDQLPAQGESIVQGPAIDYAEWLTANGNWDLSERWDDVLADLTSLEPPDSEVPDNFEVPNSFEALDSLEVPNSFEAPNSFEVLDSLAVPDNFEVPNNSEVLDSPETPNNVEIPATAEAPDNSETPDNLEIPNSPESLEQPPSPPIAELEELFSDEPIADIYPLDSETDANWNVFAEWDDVLAATLHAESALTLEPANELVGEPAEEVEPFQPPSVALTEVEASREEAIADTHSPDSETDANWNLSVEWDDILAATAHPEPALIEPAEEPVDEPVDELVGKPAEEVEPFEPPSAALTEVEASREEAIADTHSPDSETDANWNLSVEWDDILAATAHPEPALIEPADESIDEPVEESAEEPANEPVDKPIDELVGEPAEEVEPFEPPSVARTEVEASREETIADTHSPDSETDANWNLSVEWDDILATTAQAQTPTGLAEPLAIAAPAEDEAMGSPETSSTDTQWVPVQSNSMLAATAASDSPDLAPLAAFLEAGSSTSQARPTDFTVLEVKSDADVALPDADQTATVRVPVRQLNAINDLFGELTIERNGLDAYLKRLRQLSQALSRRARLLDHSNAQMRTLYDRVTPRRNAKSSLALQAAAMDTADWQEIYSARREATTALPDSLPNSLPDSLPFDALELDQYSDLHLLSQQVMETIVQIQEVNSDIGLCLDDAEQTVRELNKTARHLQTHLTQIRTSPLSQVLERFPRTLREWSLRYGKQARLEIKGGNTPIDRTILDALHDPLMHLFRNAFDHGIEDPDTRRAANKPPEGVISIQATQQSNRTVIKISDDGSGISLDQIRARAAQMGLDPSLLETASDPELLSLIFEPGFSTRETVSALSGRGVGMDVVRESVRQMRGDIRVDTHAGSGTTFTLSVPFTLSVIQVLLVESQGMLLAFPTEAIAAVRILQPQDITTTASGEMIDWQGTLVPVIRLADWLQFNCPHQPQMLEALPTISSETVMLVRHDDRPLAILVERSWGEQEVAIRRADGPIAMPTGLTGCAIVADGRVVPLTTIAELLNAITNKQRQGKLVPVDRPPTAPPPTPSLTGLLSAARSTPELLPVRKATILVVDDSINVRRFLALTLERAGYRVEQAKDGQEALEKLQRGLTVAAVICDIEMPRLDGFGFLAKMKAQPALKQIPVAMLTSRSGDKHQQLALSLGAVAYFSKPYNEQLLLRTLDEIILSCDEPAELC